MKKTTILNPAQDGGPYPGKPSLPKPAAPASLPDPITTYDRPKDSEFERGSNDPKGKSPVTIPDPNHPDKNLRDIGNKTSFSSLPDKKGVKLEPNTRYDYPSRGASFFTDDKGKIKWVEVDSTKTHDPNAKNPDNRGNIELRRDALRPDAQYKIDDNWQFNTDGNGQTVKMSGTPHYKDAPNKLPDENYYRDSTSQGHAGEEGRKVHPQWNWAGGHLAAHEAGGPGESINMYPQRETSNSGHEREGMTNRASWRYVENMLSDAHTRGSTIERIEVNAPRGPDGIPVSATYRWIETDKHGTVTVNEVEFPNVANYNHRDYEKYNPKGSGGTKRKQPDGSGQPSKKPKKSKP